MPRYLSETMRLIISHRRAWKETEIEREREGRQGVRENGKKTAVLVGRIARRFFVIGPVRARVCVCVCAWLFCVCVFVCVHIHARSVSRVARGGSHLHRDECCRGCRPSPRAPSKPPRHVSTPDASQPDVTTGSQPASVRVPRRLFALDSLRERFAVVPGHGGNIFCMETKVIGLCRERDLWSRSESWQYNEWIIRCILRQIKSQLLNCLHFGIRGQKHYLNLCMDFANFFHLIYACWKWVELTLVARKKKLKILDHL